MHTPQVPLLLTPASLPTAILYGSPVVRVFAQIYTRDEYVPRPPSGVQYAPGRMVGNTEESSC
jgi:hypothetical protein